MKKYYKLSKNYWLMIGYTANYRKKWKITKVFIKILDSRSSIECW